MTSPVATKDHIWEDINLRLNSLASNRYKQKFPVSKVTGACGKSEKVLHLQINSRKSINQVIELFWVAFTGMSEEDCKLVISTESLKELEQEYMAYGRFVGRLRQTRNRLFGPEKL